MANLRLIKDIAKSKGVTLEHLAVMVGLKSQAIHLMVRTGSTSIDTLERIARELSVPSFIFFDYDFDFEEFRQSVIMGGCDAYSYFGSSKSSKSGKSDDSSDNHLPDKDDSLEEELKTCRATINTLKEQLKHSRDLLRDTKGLLKGALQQSGELRVQVKELREDKTQMKSDIGYLREHNKELQDTIKSLGEEINALRAPKDPAEDVPVC